MKIIIKNNVYEVDSRLITPDGSAALPTHSETMSFKTV